MFELLLYQVFSEGGGGGGSFLYAGGDSIGSHWPFHNKPLHLSVFPHDVRIDVDFHL